MRLHQHIARSNILSHNPQTTEQLKSAVKLIHNQLHFLLAQRPQVPHLSNRVLVLPTVLRPIHHMQMLLARFEFRDVGQRLLAWQYLALSLVYF